MSGLLYGTATAEGWGPVSGGGGRKLTILLEHKEVKGFMTTPVTTAGGQRNRGTCEEETKHLAKEIEYKYKSDLAGKKSFTRVSFSMNIGSLP